MPTFTWKDLSLVGKAEMCLEPFELLPQEREAVVEEWSKETYPRTPDGMTAALADLMTLCRRTLLARTRPQETIEAAPLTPEEWAELEKTQDEPSGADFCSQDFGRSRG